MHLARTGRPCVYAPYKCWLAKLSSVANYDWERIARDKKGWIC